MALPLLLLIQLIILMVVDIRFAVRVAIYWISPSSAHHTMQWT